MQAHIRNLNAIFFLLCLTAALGLGCSENGDGEFNLDEVQGGVQTQSLSVQIDGEIAALELDLPFEPSDTVVSSISVSVDPDNDDTILDYAVTKEGGQSKLKVAIVNGHERGFNGQDIQITFSYKMFGSKQGQKLFDRVEVDKVLNANFSNGEIACSWVQ